LWVSANLTAVSSFLNVKKYDKELAFIDENINEKTIRVSLDESNFKRLKDGISILSEASENISYPIYIDFDAKQCNMIIEDNSESYKEFLKIVDEKVAEFKKSNKDNLALTMFAFNLDEFHEQFKKAALQDNLTNTEEQVEKLEMKYPLTMDEIFKANIVRAKLSLFDFLNSATFSSTIFKNSL